MLPRQSHDRDHHADSGITGKFGTRKRILLQKVGVKSVSRQVGITPDQAAAFAYRLEDLIFVDLRL